MDLWGVDVKRGVQRERDFWFHFSKMFGETKVVVMGETVTTFCL